MVKGLDLTESRFAPQHLGGHNAAVRHSEECAVRARNLTDIDDPTIENVQVLLLLSNAFFQAGKGKKSYMLLSQYPTTNSTKTRTLTCLKPVLSVWHTPSACIESFLLASAYHRTNERDVANYSGPATLWTVSLPRDPSDPPLSQTRPYSYDYPVGNPILPRYLTRATSSLTESIYQCLPDLEDYNKVVDPC